MNRSTTSVHPTVLYSVVVLPKLRTILTGENERRVEQLVRTGSEVQGWHIDELTIHPNYIQVVSQIKPTGQVNKGASF